jgi:hypothetical protein
MEAFIMVLMQKEGGKLLDLFFRKGKRKRGKDIEFS